jgi:hypothetical protein
MCSVSPVIHAESDEARKTAAGAMLFVEMFFGNRFERREFVNAGVIDQNIDPTERLLRRRKESCDFRLLRNVGLDGDGSPASLCNFVHDAICVLL